MATEDTNVSPAARRACERAAEIVRPHLDEDSRVVDVHRNLRALAGSDDDETDRLAKSLTAVKKAEMGATRDGEMSPADRAQNSKATRAAQARYLREVSPAGAAAWEAGRVA